MSVKVRPFRGREDKWEVDVRFVWPDGTDHRERIVAPGTSRSAAQRWGEQRERELLAKGKPKPEEVKRQIPTLTEFKPRYIEVFCRAERQKPSTIEHKEIALRAYIEPLMGSKQLHEINNTDVQKLKAAMAKQSPKSCNNVLTVLSTVLKKAVEWRVIDAMPCTIKLLKVHYGERAFYDFDDLEKLIDGAGKVDARAQLVVLLGANAGLRLGEILALRWPNVLFDRGLVRVCEADWNGETTLPKGGRGRDVPMSARLAQALQAVRPGPAPSGRGRVLWGEAGAPLTAKQVRSWMRAAQKAAGFEQTGLIHILRHTFCSHLSILGAPAKAIQELAGHTELTTTMRYLHLSPSARTAAIGLFDKPLPSHLHATPVPLVIDVGDGRGDGSAQTTKPVPMLPEATHRRGDMLETEVVGEKKPRVSAGFSGWGTRIRT